MSEKRKPSAKIVAIVSGKRIRVELYRASLWPRKFSPTVWGRYRVRINGKWQHGDHTFTLSNVMAQMRSLLHKRMKGQPRRESRHS